MKRLVICLALLVGCAETPIVVHNVTPYRMITCHTDPKFTFDEQEKIGNSSNRWALFSEYHAVISTPADLHFNNVGTLGPCAIFKVDSSNRMVKKAEAQYYALHPDREKKDVIHMFTQGQRIFVISDRVRPEEFEWEITHEMGHVLGLDDIDDEMGHVMSRVGPFVGTDFTERDRMRCRLQGVCP